MKKILYICLFIGTLVSMTPHVTHAMYLPKTVSIGDKSSYEAGSSFSIDITQDKKTPIGLRKNLEYGVARTVENDGITFFEIITTEVTEIGKEKDLSNLTVSIPNILDVNATNTYVVYTKFYEKNNPDNDSFFFTEEFSIIKNDKPFTQVANINLLQSNGKRYAITHGPSIYHPTELTKDATVATSTSLEITFESNQDTSVQPRISFSKIRSDAFTQELEVDPITIVNGKTYAKIALPAFDYEPGVYMGTLSFDGVIANKVDFQYIVAGDSVSVGTISIVKEGLKKLFAFEIFGNPLDMDRTAAQDQSAIVASTTPMIYKVTTEFINSKDKTVYTLTQDVDFNTNRFTVEILPEYGDVAHIHTVVTSLAGKVVYDGTKEVGYKSDLYAALSLKKILFVSLYILLMLITVIAIWRSYVKIAILCSMILLGMFLTKEAFADFNPSAYLERSAIAVYSHEGVGQAPTVIFRDNIVGTIYTCGENITLVFKVYYLRCTNTVPNLRGGFSWTGYVVPTTVLTTSVSANTNFGNFAGHQFYRSYSAWISKRMPAPITIPTDLYVSINHTVNTTGYSRYKIPIQTTCQAGDTICRCANRTQNCYQDGVQISSTPSAPACALQASCSYTYSTNGQKVLFETLPVNRLGTITYTDTDTNKTISKIYAKKIVGTSTIVHNVKIRDSFDGALAYASCSTASLPDVVTPPVTDSSTSTISSFGPVAPVVRRGVDCEYNWNVENVDQCTMTINDTNVFLSNLGITGPLRVATLDGLNQRARITCIRAASTSTPAVTISTSTLCQVLPEVIER